jgi:hypothetical protein
MSLVPPGGLEPPPHGLRARRAAFTLRRESCSWSEWRDSNPHLKAWKARGQPLPHIRVGSAYGYRTRPSALATRDASSTPRPNVDRYRSPAHRLSSVVKDPALASTSARTARFGDSARIRTRTHEVWRLGCFRYTTLSLLLQISTVSETNPPHDLTRAFCRASGPKQKRPSRGSP